mmetsp:Transcript_28529/g.86066  ORF Transcript_28529/g.86066 Transcript_28529/m.86066 type:complete len:137 (-) Transcript_28529:559-969(-)
MFRHARPLHALCLSASGGPARFLSSYPSDLRPLRARSGRPRHIHVAPRGVAASSSEARATHPEGAAKFPVPARTRAERKAAADDEAERPPRDDEAGFLRSGLARTTAKRRSRERSATGHATSDSTPDLRRARRDED